MAVIGLDVGTTAAKCSAYNESGKLLSGAGVEYGADIINRGENHVINFENLLNAVFQILADCAKNCKEEIEAVCISNFGETFAAVDKNGVPLLPAMLYTDNSGIKQLEKLLPHSEEILSVCGIKPHQMYSLPKILFIKENHPEVYKKAYKFLTPQDFIIYRLTGNAAIDYSDASRTMAFDIREYAFSDKILNYAGVEKDKFSTPVKTGAVVSEILPSVAVKLNISKKCVVVTGGQDQICAALGAGIVKEGMAADGMGTVECITPYFDKPITDKKMQDNGYACVPYAFENSYVTYAFNFAGGATLKWYRDNFLQYEAEKHDNVYAYFDKNLKEKPTDLFILPHLLGSATPYMDGASRGAIIGLTINTDKRDIYKAIFEGLTYEMMVNAELLKNAGVNINCLHATGGGSRSEEWIKLKASMMGIPFKRVIGGEGGITGAAMLAFTALKKFKGLKEAAKVFVNLSGEYIPDMKLHKIYSEKFEKYKKAYKNVKDILAE